MQTTGTHNRARFQVFTALRHRSFLRYWLGLVTSVMGFQIMTVAQGWLIYEMTGSKLFLGYVGLAAGLEGLIPTQNTVLVLSGGNLDPGPLQDALSSRVGQNF